MSSHRTSRYRTQKSPDWRFLFVLRLLILLSFVAFGLCILFWYELPISESYDMTLPKRYRYAMGILVIVYAFYRFFVNLPKKEKNTESTGY